ncbi:hypothetical protein [Spirillospora sp. CA-294931]|uniref:hypothetical protein n=1 Tax=Spirillospora sp. CA-294931 TaxID=3240042 RepID=UPI003D90A37C
MWRRDRVDEGEPSVWRGPLRFLAGAGFAAAALGAGAFGAWANYDGDDLVRQRGLVVWAIFLVGVFGGLALGMAFRGTARWVVLGVGAVGGLVVGFTWHAKESLVQPSGHVMATVDSPDGEHTLVVESRQTFNEGSQSTARVMLRTGFWPVARQKVAWTSSSGGEPPRVRFVGDDGFEVTIKIDEDESCVFRARFDRETLSVDGGKYSCDP